MVDSSIETKNIGADDEYQVPNLTESVSVDSGCDAYYSDKLISGRGV